MKTTQFFRVIVTAAVVSGASLTATAQQQTSQTSAPQKQEAKPTPAKAAKVWSDDDLSSLRSPSDNYQMEQDYLQQVKKQANDPSVSGLEKKRVEWRLESHTATAQHLASEIKQLQADRDALAKKAAAGTNAPATPPPSQ